MRLSELAYRSGNQHTACATGAGCFIWRRCRQGCGQPGLAQSVGWDAWNARALAGWPSYGSLSRVWSRACDFYKELTFIFLLVALGVRQDGQKVLSAVKNMWGERTSILERGATGL